MEKTKIFFGILVISIFLFACEQESCETDLRLNQCVGLKNESFRNDTLTFVRESESNEDSVKVIMGESLEILRENGLNAARILQDSLVCFVEKTGEARFTIKRSDSIVVQSDLFTVETVDVCHAEPTTIFL